MIDTTFDFLTDTPKGKDLDFYSSTLRQRKVVDTMALKSSNVTFRPAIPTRRPVSLEDMTKEEFDAKIARGLAQAKAGEGVPADEFFDSLKEEIIKSYV